MQRAVQATPRADSSDDRAGPRIWEKGFADARVRRQETIVCPTLESAVSSGVRFKQEIGQLASLDWSQCPDVESIPGKVSGAWVLKGTRMPVSAIFENLQAGANLDDIMEWFDGLDREQAKAVIAFAVRSLDKAPAYAQ